MDALHFVGGHPHSDISGLLESPLRQRPGGYPPVKLTPEGPHLQLVDPRRIELRSAKLQEDSRSRA